MNPRRLLIPIAFLAFASLALPDGLIGVAWPSVMKTFSLPVSYLGLIGVASALGYLLSSVFTGPIVRSMGIGKLLLISSVLVVISLSGNALTPFWIAMILFGFIGGMGAGAIDAGLNAYSAHTFSPKMVTWLHACFGIGATIGPLVMTTVITSGIVWRWGYGTVAIAMVGLSIVFLLTVNLWDQDAHGAGSSEKAHGARMIETLRLPIVWLHMGLFIFYCGIESMTGHWLFTLLTKSRGVDERTAGSVVAGYWFSLTAGRFLFGIAADRFSRRAILRCVICIVPIAAGMIWYRPIPELNFLGAIILGLMLAPIYPLLMSATPSRVGPAHANNAVGLQVSVSVVGFALSGVCGILARHVNLETIGAFIFANTLVLLIIHEWTMLTIRKSPGIAQPIPAA